MELGNSQTLDACFGWLRSFAWVRRLIESRLGNTVSPSLGHIGDFVAVLFSGLVVSGALFGLSAKEGMEFVNENVEHVKPTVLVLGLFLVGVSVGLTGWPPIRCLSRVFVLPFCRLCHHLCLVGAGAILALFAFAGAASSATAPTLVYAAIVLLLGGAEYQFAAVFLEKNDDKIPGWLRISGGLVLAVLIGRLLLKEIARIHA